MRIVTLYAKAGCPLCDEARELLEELLPAQSYELREVDIRRSPELFERYRFRIPVVQVDDEERLEGNITADAVRDLVE